MWAKYLNKLILFMSRGSIAACFTLAHFAFATANSGITYHGRIIKPDGTSLTDSSVQFKMQIRTPDAQGCLMYEEVQIKDLSASQGAFAITINDGTGTRTDSSGVLFDRVFANYGSLSLSAATCLSGTGSWTPNSSDGRAFQVYFKSSSMTAWEPLPSQTINYAPFAIEAKQVAGFPAISLVRVDTGSGPGTIRALTSSEGSALLDLVSGVSTKYVQSTTGGATLPSFSTNPSSPAAGDVWYDSTSKILKYYDGTAVQAVGSGSGSGTVTSVTAGTGLSGGTITTTGTISLPNTGTAGTYTKVTTDAQGRVTAGAQITGSDITSGTIGGSTAINTTGNITTSGNVIATNVSSTTDSTIGLKIYESTDTNAVTVTAPAGLVSGGYGLVLPANKASVAGQVLTSDTSGNLSWTTPSSGSGSVTSVAMTVPSFLSVSGSPITSSGTLAVSLATQNANLVFAGPSSGGAAAPTFRALASADIPNLDWSKITTGVPTTLNGYGITDAVKNAGNSPSLQQGLDAALPAAGTAGRLYVATDTKKLYRDNGSTWDVISASSGGITALTGDVSASGTGSVAATVNKVNGVTYPSGPSTNTVPVVTASNTITYEAVPNAALANSAITLGSTSVSLGSTAASIAGLTSLTSATLTGNTVNVGVDGTTAGALNLYNTTSGGGVKIQNPSTASTYNFNLPASAGSSGQVLMSAGGGSSAMTWGTLTVGSGGTGLSGGTQGGIPYFASSSTMASSAALTAHAVVLGGGTTAPYSISALGSTGNVLLSNGSSADPSFGALNLAGGTNYVTGTLPVSNGGTGAASLTAHGVLVGEGTSAVSALSAAAAGTLLAGQGGSADPAFSATPILGVASTTTGSLTFANSGTAFSTTLQSSGSSTAAWTLTLPAGPGTSGQVLQTNGSGVTSWTSLSASLPTLSDDKIWVGQSGTPTEVTISGDTTMTNAGAVTVSKVNGVAYPAAPSTNTVPVVTGSNTVTYGTVPNAALTNSSITLGSTSVSLGGTAASIAGLTSLTSTTLTGNTVNVGVDGTTAGALNIYNTTSGGGVKIQNPSNATSYNFNLPTSAGSSGQVLMSAGGGSSPMTWGTLNVASGGTGLSGGTQGGIPYFASSTTMASSAALTSHAVVLGGGTTAPYAISALGSTGNVLLSNGSSADPSFGALNLAGGANYVSGILPVSNGGTGASSLTAHGVLIGEGTSAATALSAAGAGTLLTGQGTSSDPAFSATPTLGVASTTTGSLTLANAGTAFSTTVQSSGSTTAAWTLTLPSGPGTSGQVLQTNGSGVTSWMSLSATLPTLADDKIWVGQSGTATAVTMGGDATMTNAGVLTVSKVNGVAYPSAPSTNTVPVVTGSNTVTYGTVPNAALTNSSITLGSTSVSLGATAASIAGLTSLTSTTLTGNTVNVGVDGTTAGALNIYNTTSGGGVKIQNPSNATSYNFNLPASAGSSGQVLLSGGGVSSPMTWGTLTVGSGGTGLSGGTQGGIPYFASSSTMASSAALTAHAVVLGGGTTAPYAISALGSTGNVLMSNGSSADPSFGALNLAGGSNYVSGILPVANGGTGASTLTAHGLLVGEGTSAVTALSAAATGTLLAGQGTSADPAFSATPTLGVVSSTTGSLTFANASSTKKTTIQSSASNSVDWTLTLPPNKGTSGYVLQTDGTGTTSWTAAGPTGTGTANYVPVWATSSTLGNSPIAISGSNVGIGTTSPNSPLVVQDDTQVARIRVRSASSTNGAGYYFGNDTDADYASYIVLMGSGTTAFSGANSLNVVSTRGDLGLYASTTGNGVERMRILSSNGNVGIGTASPGQKLSVAGTIESTSGGFKFPDGTTQTTAVTAASIGAAQAFFVHKNGTNQTGMSANTFTKMTWSTATYDTTSAFNLSTSRFTPTQAGKYFFTLQIACDATGYCQPAIYKNGTAVALSYNYNSTTSITNSVSAIVDMNGTTDYIEAYGATSGTYINGTANYTFFTGNLVTSSTVASTGSGTTNYIPLWSSSTALGNSPMAVSSGNVGIGTTAPSVNLHVYGSNSGGGVEGWINNASSGSSAYSALRLRNDTGNLTMFLNSSGRSGDGGTNNATLRNDAGALLLESSGGAGMYIAPTSGYVGLGTTSPAVQLDVEGSAGAKINANTSWAALELRNQLDAAANGSAGYRMIEMYQQNTWRGEIYVDGSGAHYGNASDYRLKENLKPMDNALERVLKLPVYSFNYKTSPGVKTEGFLAHEAQAVAPYAVSGTKDGVDKDGKPLYQVVDYGSLTPLLTGSIQELHGLCMNQERRLAAVEAENEKIKAENNMMKAYLCAKDPQAPFCH